ncbi:MAG: hypothetical protein HYY12_07015 [Candidatus Methylomirabilis oxyfera]|nr:hypothetical protein [Candidatus Methylomirabilis oxyfera]
MSKRWRAWDCFAAGAALALFLATAGLVAANTELTPAARLVAPFFDISAGHDTFLILTNVSRNVFLDGTTFPCGPKGAGTCGPFAVHVEFYGQSCNRVDLNVSLSPGDIDLLDLRLTPLVKGSSLPGGALGPVTPTASQSGLGGRGWVDIDVRFGPPGGPTFAASGVQANVLMGTVLITDFASDTAIEYPMAPGIGISNNGLLGRIVRRDAAGRATDWSGRYEPFPWRVFVPAFFAEGTQTVKRVFTTSHTAFLALAAPADGNWDGSGNGEAPGQRVGAPGSLGEPLIVADATVFDGCELLISATFTSHYVNNFLSAIFGPLSMNRNNWTAANCGIVFGGRDELSGQPVGWIDLTNTRIACDNTTPGGGASNCPAYGGSTATALHAPGVGTGQPRGMVGVLIENTRRSFVLSRFSLPHSPTASATRLWGDRTPWEFGQGDGPFPHFALCSPNVKDGSMCNYSFERLISNQDIAQHSPLGPLADAVPSAGEFP